VLVGATGKSTFTPPLPAGTVAVALSTLGVGLLNAGDHVKVWESAPAALNATTAVAIAMCFDLLAVRQNAAVCGWDKRVTFMR
jgi:hypothetical protein